MSDDISLLPEEQRKREDQLKHTEPPKKAPAMPELRFSVPKEEGEDIEVIEIDEGEVEQVLANEPPLTRLVYKAATFFQDLGHKLFQPHEIEPPPKLPPQFFTPPPAKPKIAPVGGLLPTTGGPTKPPAPAAPGAPGVLSPVPAPSGTVAPSLMSRPDEAAKPKAKIMPFDKAPRRVRVIKRIRKPVRVSFVSDDELALLRIDIPKRKFTFFTTAVLFILLLGGGYYLLDGQVAAASGELAKADSQLKDVNMQIQDKQKTWMTFQDLEPRLKALAGLLDRHISPTKLFVEIEQHTLPSVSYDSFSLTSDGHVALQVTADSFETAAEQIVAFQSSGFVSKADASGYRAVYDPPESFVPKSVQFQIDLTLAPNALQVSAPVAATQ